MTTDNDRLPQHPAGEQLGEIKHACPDCPSPLVQVGELARVPNPMCPWCHGTGLLTVEQLDQWQRAQWGANRLR